MADVIRQDVVQIGFETDLAKLKAINKLVDDLVEGMTGKKGKDALDDVKEKSNNAVKPLKKLKETADGLNQKLNDIGKKGAVAAFNGLKKVAGVSLKAFGVTAAAAAAATGAIVTQSAKAFADYEQLVGGVETLFGAKGAKTVQEYAKIVGKPVDKVKDEFAGLMEVQNSVMDNAKVAWKSSGMSANAYMETVTGFSASLIQSVGGDTKKAAELADMAIIDMSDNANKMGTDIESIKYAYQGFAKQNYTMLDNLKLGYGGTKEEMARLIKDAAKIDKSVDANSMSYANIVKAVHAVQESLYITGTTQKEAEKTVTGSLNAMKAAYGNLLTAIGSGDGIDEAIDNMVKSMSTFGDNIMPVIERSFVGIGKVVESLAPKIAAALPRLAQDLIPSLVSSASVMVGGLVKALPTIVGALAKEIPNALSSVTQAVGDAFGIDVTPFQNIIVKLQEIGGNTGRMNALKGVFQSIKNIVGTLAQATSDLAVKFLDFITSEGVLKALKFTLDAVGAVLGFVANNADWLGAVFLTVVGAIKAYNLVMGIMKAIQIASTIAQFAYAAATGTQVAATTAATAAQLGLNTAMLASPTTWIIVGVIAALAALIAIIVVVVKHWDKIKAAAANCWEGIKSIFSKVGEFFGNVFSVVKEKIISVFQAGGQVFNNIKDGIVNVFTTVVNGIIRGINKVVSVPFKGLNKILNKINGLEIAGIKPFDWLTWRAPVPQIPELANGGLLTRPTLNVAGEAGPEMVIPLSASRRGRGLELWQKAGSMLGAYSPEGDAAGSSRVSSRESNTYAPVFNLTINGASDDRAMARKIKRWVAESVDDMFTGMAHKSTVVREA